MSSFEAVLDLLPQEQRGSFVKEDGQVVIDDAGESNLTTMSAAIEPGGC